MDTEETLRNLNSDDADICPVCKGRGVYQYSGMFADSWRRCLECDGEGWVLKEEQ